MHIPERQNVDVSKNSGIPKSSILIGFSIINHLFWGTPIFGNTYVAKVKQVKQLPRSWTQQRCNSFNTSKRLGAEELLRTSGWLLGKWLVGFKFRAYMVYFRVIPPSALRQFRVIDKSPADWGRTCFPFQASGTKIRSFFPRKMLWRWLAKTRRNTSRCLGEVTKNIDHSETSPRRSFNKKCIPCALVTNHLFFDETFLSFLWQHLFFWSGKKIIETSPPRICQQDRAVHSEPRSASRNIADRIQKWIF